MDVVGTNNLGVGVNAGLEPTAAGPVLDITQSVVGRRADPGSDLLECRIASDIQGLEVLGKGLKDVVNELTDGLSVALIGIEKARRRCGNSLSVKTNTSKRPQTRGTVNVQGNGTVFCEVNCARGVDGTLATDSLVALLDEVPESASLRAERVRPGASLQVEFAIGRDRVGVIVVVGGNGLGEELDEGVRIVEDLITNSAVVDPLARGKCELACVREAAEAGFLADAGPHKQLRAEKSTGRENNASAFGDFDNRSGVRARELDLDASCGLTVTDHANNLGSSLKMEVRALERRLEVGLNGSAPLATLVVVDGVSKNLSLLVVLPAIVQANFSVACTIDEPLFGSFEATLQVALAICRWVVGRRLLGMNLCNRTLHVGVLPSSGKVQVPIRCGGLEEETSVDGSVATNCATLEGVHNI